MQRSVEHVRQPLPGQAHLHLEPEVLVGLEHGANDLLHRRDLVLQAFLRAYLPSAATAAMAASLSAWMEMCSVDRV